LIEDFYNFLNLAERSLSKEKMMLFLNVELYLKGDKLISKLKNSAETWKEKILLAENLYLRKHFEESTKIVKMLERDYAVPEKAPEVSGFIFAYNYPEERVKEVLNRFLSPKVSGKKLYRFLKFFFRYAFIFDRDISSSIELIVEKSLEKLSFSSLLSALLNYFLPAFFVKPRGRVVNACIPLLDEIDTMDPRNLRFASAILLAKSYFDKKFVLEKYRTMTEDWYFEPSRKALFQSSLSILGRTILIYAISRLDEFLDEAKKLSQDIYVTSSYIRDAHRDVRKSAEITFDDAPIYLSEVEEDAIESIFNPKVYLLRSSLNVKEAIIGLATILLQRKIIGLNIGDFYEIIRRGSEELPKLPLHERADLLGSLNAIEDKHSFQLLLKELWEKRESKNIAQAYYFAGIWLGNSFPILNSFLLIKEYWRKIVCKNEFLEGFSYGAYGIATSLVLKKLREGP